MQKRKNLMLILLSAVIFLLPSCDMNKEGTDTKTYEATLGEAKKINQESSLGMEYLSLSSLSEQQAKQYGADNPEMKFTDDGNVEGYYFHYPKKSKDRRLAQIRIKGGDYRLFDIRVGDNVQDAEKILIEKEYRKTEPLYVYQDTNTVSYIKYDVHITLETEKDSYTVKSILLSKRS